MRNGTAVLAAVLATGMFGGAPLAAAGGPAPSASVCSECCGGDSLCLALADLSDLRAAVDELVPQHGLATSLEAKVDAATNAVAALRLTPALNQLDAFGHEVDAADASGQVSGATSSVLKAKADATKIVINNLR